MLADSDLGSTAKMSNGPMNCTKERKAAPIKWLVKALRRSRDLLVMKSSSRPTKRKRPVYTGDFCCDLAAIFAANSWRFQIARVNYFNYIVSLKSHTSNHRNISYYPNYLLMWTTCSQPMKTHGKQWKENWANQRKPVFAKCESVNKDSFLQHGRRVGWRRIRARQFGGNASLAA